MIFVPKKNIYFPKRIFKSKFHQRGNFAGFPAGSMAQLGEPAFIGGPYSAFDVRISPTDSLAGVEIDADGGIERYTSQGNQGDIGRWDGNNTGLNKIDFQFRFDRTGGTSDPNGTSDAVNVWLAASAGLNNWEQLVTGIGTRIASGSLRMRDASTLQEFTSDGLTLTSSVET